MPESKFKVLVKKALSRSGYAIFKSDVRFHPELCATRLVDRLGIQLIVDVGANVGNYGHALREWGYQGRILSFEPLSEAHRRLSAAASSDSNWIVAPRCALGAARNVAMINISANQVSSSLLGMLQNHCSAAPGSGYVGTEEIEVHPLDEVINEWMKPDDALYLKIDTQGFEQSVLEGSAATLRKCKAVQMEMSLIPLYDGGFLFDEALAFMRTQGFRLFALYPGFTDRVTGQTLQVDGVFVQGTPGEGSL